MSKKIHFLHQVSISPTFYNKLFHTKVFCAVFHCLHFGFANFVERKLLQKLLLVKFITGRRNHQRAQEVERDEGFERDLVVSRGHIDGAHVWRWISQSRLTEINYIISRI